MCPFCRNTDSANTKEDSEGPAPPITWRADAPAMTENSNANTSTTQGSAGSTLIEFPGVNRNRPAWRKELSERFREIQQRRAREAALEEEQEFIRADVRAEDAPASNSSEEAKASAQLGLVPSPDEPEINPIVAAALRRIERARSQESAAHVTRGGSHRTHGPATATARVYDERPEPLVEDAPASEVEQTRATPLVVVSPTRPAVTAEAKAVEVEMAAAPAVEEKAATVETETLPVVEATSRVNEQVAERVTERVTEEPAKTVAAQTKVAAAQARQAQVEEETQESSKQPRHISGVLDEFWLERNGVELLPKIAEPEVTYDDRAPRFKRLIAAVIDLFVVALICAPFAAAIELTISNWNDPRVWGSMAGIAATAMFLYHTCALALAGRTAGMSLCGLRTVDARKACVPTTGQCARRALVYMFSLATLGLGIIYSLFDAEGRAAHDILSGTVVVRH